VQSSPLRGSAALSLAAPELRPAVVERPGDDAGVIANMLGVRRTGVTEAAGKLHRDGLVDYHRGHITVLDRAKLEERVCECYAVVRAEYDRLLG